MYRVMVNSAIGSVRGFRNVEISEISDEIVEHFRLELQNDIDSIRRKAKGIISELEKDGVDASSLMDLFVSEKEDVVSEVTTTETKTSKKSKKTVEEKTEEETIG